VNDPSSSLADQASAVASNSAKFGRTFFGYLQNGSFVRWRELALTYVVPDAFTHKLQVRSASITVTGRNLHVFTDYPGVDPEVNASPGFGEGYSDNPTPPPVRYWLLRVNLGF
jgi:hypothetical protein